MSKVLRLNMTDRTYHLDEKSNPKHGWPLDDIIHDCRRGAASGPPSRTSQQGCFCTGYHYRHFGAHISSISVGAKSPLTGGIKESNAGTSWATDLASMQVKALVVEGQPAEKDKFWGVYLTWDAGLESPRLSFSMPPEYAGKNLYDVFPKLYQRLAIRYLLPDAASPVSAVTATQAWFLTNGQASQPLFRTRRPGLRTGQ